MRLVVVSNRLPVVIEEDGRLQAASGGLITALAPVLREHCGRWIGWAGVCEEDGLDVERIFAGSHERFGYDLTPLIITREQQVKFYQGFANEVLWPLFHGLDAGMDIDPTYWQAYLDVNRRFAEATRAELRDGDRIWVHDYHLGHVGRELRAVGVGCKIAYFLHIPFPPLEIFARLPWRRELIEALLDYDLVGFQTPRHRQNFIDCCQSMLPHCRVNRRSAVYTIDTHRRLVRVGVFPISIDFDEFARDAAAPGAEEFYEVLCQQMPDRHIFLGVDRLDYTKGIPNRLRALRAVLSRRPDLHGKLTLVQVVVPSRENIPAYQKLKEDVEGLVGEIDGLFTRPGWVPVHYIFRALNRPELLAYYRAARTALVTPLNDGMNLVAKEYCACNLDEQGVLILSEFAGAAAELRPGALVINPYDINSIAEAIEESIAMPGPQRRARMRCMRRIIRRHNIHRWADHFLDEFDGPAAEEPAGNDLEMESLMGEGTR